jgi:hypothetical protein
MRLPDRQQLRVHQGAGRWAQEIDARFIYASSAATYGDGAQGMDDRDDNLARLRPLNMYGYSKHLFDLHAQREGWLKRIVGVKYFNVFGPNEDHKGDMRSLVNKAYQQILATGRVQPLQEPSSRLQGRGADARLPLREGCRGDDPALCRASASGHSRRALQPRRARPTPGSRSPGPSSRPCGANPPSTSSRCRRPCAANTSISPRRTSPSSAHRLHSAR